MSRWQSVTTVDTPIPLNEIVVRYAMSELQVERGRDTEKQYENHHTTAKKLQNQVDDRWRYVCVNCESTCIVVRTHVGFPANYKEVNRTMGDYKGGHVHDYRCKQCGHVSDTVYDKKAGGERQSIES